MTTPAPEPVPPVPAQPYIEPDAAPTIDPPADPGQPLDPSTPDSPPDESQPIEVDTQALAQSFTSSGGVEL